MKRLIVVATILVFGVWSQIALPTAAEAQGYPTGADIITAATNGSISTVMTNVATNSVVIVSNAVYAVSPGTNIVTGAGTTNTVYQPANNRVRTIITGPAFDTWIGYGPTGPSNTVYLSGTNGIPLPSGGVWTNARPFLWKGPITLTCTNTLTSNATATATWKFRDEFGSF